MNWNNLTSENQLKELIEESNNTPILIFKHSTRCSISSMVKSRLERSWDDSAKINAYYLDLIEYRDISNKIAEELSVPHQSPQAILLKNGKVAHDSSHMAISYSNFSKSILD